MPRLPTGPTSSEIPKQRVKWCKNAAAIAVDQGVTRQAVVQWQQQGCPSYLLADGTRLYDNADVLWWRIARSTGKTKLQILAEDERRASARDGRCTCGAR